MDLHILAGEFPPTPYPITPGHEFAGIVAARGADVRPDLPVGARVAVDPSLYCGYCRRCRAGRDNLCENWAAIGDTVNGAFAEFVAVPAVNAYRLPDQLDGQLGAMVEPLACAVHGLRRLERAGPVSAEPTVVIGAGTALLPSPLLERGRRLWGLAGNAGHHRAGDIAEFHIVVLRGGPQDRERALLGATLPGHDYPEGLVNYPPGG